MPQSCRVSVAEANFIFPLPAESPLVMQRASIDTAGEQALVILQAKRAVGEHERERQRDPEQHGDRGGRRR